MHSVYIYIVCLNDSFFFTSDQLSMAYHISTVNNYMLYNILKVIFINFVYFQLPIDISGTAQLSSQHGKKTMEVIDI